MRSALAELHRTGRLVCIEEFGLKSEKTGELEKALSGGLGLKTKTLLVCEENENNLMLAARNNPRLSVTRALAVNVVDLVGHESTLISEAALKSLTEVLAK